jgi:hypothetical protein
MCLNRTDNILHPTVHHRIAASANHQAQMPSARSVFGRCIATENSVPTKLPACQGIPTDIPATRERCWRSRPVACPPHFRPARSVQGVALDRGLADFTRSNAVCQDPLVSPAPHSVLSAELVYPGVCFALRFLNRNPTILSRLWVIVNPFAEAALQAMRASVPSPPARCPSFPRGVLRSPEILPYAYADVKGCAGAIFRAG